MADEKKAPLWWCRLNPKSPRYDVWRAILGNENVPLKEPDSFHVDLGDPPAERGVECYALDWESMTAPQQAALVGWVVDHFNVPANEALAECSGRGFPIRAADCAVLFSARAFI